MVHWYFNWKTPIARPAAHVTLFFGLWGSSAKQWSSPCASLAYRSYLLSCSLWVSLLSNIKKRAYILFHYRGGETKYCPNSIFVHVRVRPLRTWDSYVCQQHTKALKSLYCWEIVSVRLHSNFCLLYGNGGELGTSVCRKIKYKKEGY